jgi:multiple antibiotic resistance protein
MESSERKKTLNTALLTSFVLLVLFAIAGKQLLALFGITVYSFMIAGGILLLLLSMQLLLRGEPFMAGSMPEDIGVVLIAIPLLVGPGAITTTIVTIQTAGILATLGSIAAVMFVTYLIFRYIDKIYSLLGKGVPRCSRCCWQFS